LSVEEKLNSIKADNIVMKFLEIRETNYYSKTKREEKDVSYKSQHKLSNQYMLNKI